MENTDKNFSLDGFKIVDIKTGELTDPVTGERTTIENELNFVKEKQGKTNDGGGV